MFDFSAHRRFFMLATLDLGLGTGKVMLALAGTAIDFIADGFTGFVLLQGFGHLSAPR